ncbi:MAG: DUF805 domain-containing protein, partial [Elusimicrobiaceae bacterium]|nr:DUF805 domain-containing protein [Elusimicrobiaceae bacterium]
MLKHLFWFSSRANRTEKLFWLLILSAFSWLLTLFTPQPMLPLTAARMITWLVVMLLLLPVWWLGITLSVRRLHDMNLSGWWLLGIIILGIFLNLVTMFAFPALAGTVPGIGGLVLSAVFLSVPGTAGANR